MSLTSSDQLDSSLANEFARLWESSPEMPDVFQFLTERSEAAPGEVAAVCAIDQAQRWSRGEQLPVEDYLKQIPRLSDHPPARLQLIVSEFRNEAQHGAIPSVESFVARFPDLRDQLTRKLNHKLIMGSTALMPMPNHDGSGIAADSEEDAAEGASGKTKPVDEIPTHIGRFQVRRILGDGGFGRVYLAFDEELRRPVAIKIPHAFRIKCPSDEDAYFEEARILAALDHPNIVPVFDFGRTDDGRFYTVTKYIEGSDLSTRSKSVHLSFSAAAELLAAVADALHYSHLHGVVHRDIKPANILIDAENRPYVTDFGIALKEDDWGKDSPTAGTPAYMSPEQIRGEGHRVDGRTDVFSLGVVLYELLTGRRPFPSTRHRSEMTEEPRPPRQVDDSIPIELERICLKAMSFRIADRYSTARDLAEDLRHILEKDVESVVRSPQRPQLSSDGFHGTSDRLSATSDISIIPRGLRSFDGDDSSFFYELLPGPRNRDGLPESVRFWQTRILEQDPDKAFEVGLVYGPSGSGKSSFLKAAVIPSLPASVTHIYVESTPWETELRLLRALHKYCPHVSRDLDLAETIAALRRDGDVSSGTKVLIVLDQFEQWLHARQNSDGDELIRALRQCDGVHVQCILTVRDDFWMAVTHVMDELEIPLVPDNNIAAVDLFNPRHARKVLTAIGRAYGALPPPSVGLDRSQRQFVKRAIDDLTRNGQIIPVRLAVFGEMVKDKPWTSATLQEFGGIEGIGVTFLEETFNGRTANPACRLHQKGARAVLGMLISGEGSSIKGHMRSRQELQLGCGYEHRQKDFDALLRILDSDLRLITPTDPAGVGTDDESGDGQAHDLIPQERYYHLTHDYLVPSLNEWLSLKQKETRRGRAELLLSERAQAWESRPSSQTLPTLPEWLRILTLTRRHHRTPASAEGRVMRAAGRYYLIRLLLVVAVAAGLGWLVVESAARSNHRALVQMVQAAPPTDVREIVRQAEPSWTDVGPLLQEALHTAEPGSKSFTSLSLAVLPVDQSPYDDLFEQMLNGDPRLVHAITDSLMEFVDRQRFADDLGRVLDDPNAGTARRFRAAAASAQLPDTDPPGPARWEHLSGFAASELVREIANNQNEIGPWTELFRPVKSIMSDHLFVIYGDAERPATDRDIAATILGDYVGDQPQQLTELLLTATPQQHRTLFPHLARNRTEAVERLRTICETAPADSQKYEARSEVVRRQAGAAVLLLALHESVPVMNSLSENRDPELVAFIESRLAALAIRPELIFERLQQTDSAALRAALLRTLGGLSQEDREQLPPSWQEKCVSLFESIMSTDPSAGVHSAARWALTQWGHDVSLNPQPPDSKQWFVNGQGHTMVIFQGPTTLQMGSPTDEFGRGADDERLHAIEIDRTFAICSTETTQEQYRRHKPDSRFWGNARGPDPQCPAISVNWVEAVHYCQWLCEAEGIPEDQWPYPADVPVEYGMVLPGDFIDRTGYRLPTDAEWELACRAGANTPYCFGSDRRLLQEYAWIEDNAGGRTWPVGMLKPSQAGLFDMHGNVYESCHNLYTNATRPFDAGERRPMQPRFQTVARGGSYGSAAVDARSANRRGYRPTDRVGYTCGFRVARTLSAKQSQD